MRILTLVHEFPPVGGGGGKVAQDISVGLSARGHDVRVFTCAIRNHAGLERVDGVQVYRLRSGRKQAFRASFWDMLLYNLAAVFKGLVMFRIWKPDILHVHFAVPAGLAGWLLSRLTGVPYVLTTHLGDVPGGVPEKTDGWFRWVAPFTPGIWHQAKQVVAVSQFTRALAETRYGIQIRVIPNGVDTRVYDPGTLAVHQPPRVLFIGRVVQQKNPLQLIRVLAEAKDLNWECVVVGDGPLLPDLRAEVSARGLEGRLRFTGWLTQPEVDDWLKKSDLLFMPSFTEGMPVAGLLALSMGLAMVVSDAGGFTDLVAGQGEKSNGFICPAEDTAAFTNAIRTLLADPNLLLQYRKASRFRAAEFDLARVVEQYEEVLMNDPCGRGKTHEIR